MGAIVRFLLLTIAFNEVVAKHKVDQRYIFNDAGQIIVAVSYAHLFVPIKLEPLTTFKNELLAIQKKILALQTRPEGHQIALQILAQEMASVEHWYNELQSMLQAGNPNEVAVVRTKRQFVLAAMAVSALIGAVGGASFMGLFQADDLTDVVKAVNNNREKMDLVVTMVTDVAAGVTKNRQDITSIKNVIARVSKLTKTNKASVDVLTCVQLASSVYGLFMTNLNIIYQAYETAVNAHRLHPKLVEFSALDKAFQKLTKTANKKGYVVFTNDARAAFQMEASYMWAEQGFVVVVHVPMALPVNRFALFHFRELPIRIDGIVVKILPDREYLAINRDKTYYMSLSADEVAGCDKYHETRFCHNLQVARSVKSPDCLVLLYNNNYKEALKKCRVVIQKPTDEAISRGGNAFTVYVDEAKSGRITCLNSTYVDFPVHGFQDLQVDDGCWADVGGLRLFTSSRLPTETVRPTYKWPIPVDDLLSNMTSTDIQEIIENLKGVGEEPKELHELKTKLMAYKAIRKQEGPIMTHRWSQQIGLGTTAVVAMLIFILGVAIYCRAKRNKHNAGAVNVNIPLQPVPTAPTMGPDGKPLLPLQALPGQWGGNCRCPPGPRSPAHVCCKCDPDNHTCVDDGNISKIW